MALENKSSNKTVTKYKGIPVQGQPTVNYDINKDIQRQLQMTSKSRDHITSAANAVIWHRRLRHPNYKTLSVANKYVEGMGTFMVPKTVCATCMEAKITRKTFSEERSKANRPGFRTHADLIGPIVPAAMTTQGKYILTLVDDFSRYASTYVIKNKKETVDKIMDYFTYLRTLFTQPGHMARFRADAATEFVNAKLKRILKEFGIEEELAEAGAHQHNGTAERYNRTHQNRMRALLFDSGYPKTFWGWASDAATYLYNRTPHKANENYTPYEKFHNNRPNLKYLRMFGAVAYTWLPKVRKLDKRAGQRYILRYTDTGYILYNPNNHKTERACSVKTDETRNYGMDNRRRERNGDEDGRFPNVGQDKLDSDGNVEHNQHCKEKQSVTDGGDQEEETNESITYWSLTLDSKVTFGEPSGREIDQ